MPSRAAFCLAWIGIAAASAAWAAAPGRAAEDAIAGMPLMVLPAPAADLADTPEWRSRLADLFHEGALLDEAKRERGVLKWTRPIDLSLRGAIKPHVQFVYALADELALLTGLPVEVSTDQNWAGNIDVYISPVATYWPFFVQAMDPDDRIFTCSATPWVVEGVVRRSEVKINAGALDEASVRACIVEEVVQSLGLFGETSREQATLLNDEVGYLGLGTIDRLLLTTLYAPELRPGMPPEEAMPIAADLIHRRLGTCPEAPGC